MENFLEQMQKVLFNREKKYENDPNLRFGEEYQEINKNMQKQQKILKDCRKFYVLLRSSDEQKDQNQGSTMDRASSGRTRGGGVVKKKKGNFDFDNIRKETMGDNISGGKSRPLSGEEQAYLEKWDQYSKEMDETLEEVYQEMDIMLKKLDVINEETDKNIELTKDFQDKLGKLDEDIKFNNERLKAIVTELRAPGKICADLSLALILCMMIGVLVFVIRMYMSLEAST